MAEKFEAMIKLGTLNSRMKDFYDLWLMTRQFNFEGKNLVAAVKATFENRETPLPSGKPFFAAGIYADESVQATMWKAFLKKNPIKAAPDSFKAVVSAVEEFLSKPASLQLRWVKNCQAVGMLQSRGYEWTDLDIKEFVRIIFKKLTIKDGELIDIQLHHPWNLLYEKG